MKYTVSMSQNDDIYTRFILIMPFSNGFGVEIGKFESIKRTPMTEKIDKMIPEIIGLQK